MLVPEGLSYPYDDFTPQLERFDRMTDPVLYLAPERINPCCVGHLGQGEVTPGLADRLAELRPAGALPAAGLDDRLRGQDLPVGERADSADIIVPLGPLP